MFFNDYSVQFFIPNFNSYLLITIISCALFSMLTYRTVIMKNNPEETNQTRENK